MDIKSGESVQLEMNFTDFLLDGLNCTGTERNLAQCSHLPWTSENCGAGEHFYVRCQQIVGEFSPCVPTGIIINRTYMYMNMNLVEEEE